ncbi:MAG: DUF3459 domain-containing protein, partial [Adhaeribacter sp.]
QKLLAAAVIVSPYLPMLWMGEEYSEPNPFLYFVSHTDPELAEAVRKGRKAEFAAFHAEGEAPDPVAEETFNQSKLQWDLINQEPHQTMFKWYQTLIRLRKELPALRNLNRQNLEVETLEEHKTLVLRRWHENQQIICFLNFSKGTQTLPVPKPAKSWQKVLDSANPEWKGPMAAPETLEAGNTISLCPESFALYVNE